MKHSLQSADKKASKAPLGKQAAWYLSQGVPRETMRPFSHFWSRTGHSQLYSVEVLPSCRTVDSPPLQALLLGLQALGERLPVKLLRCRVLQTLGAWSCMLLLALRKNARLCLQRLCLFQAAAEGLDILLHIWETPLSSLHPK